MVLFLRLFISILVLSSNAFADDCDFIRSAIHSMPKTGGVIRIPAGLYNCSSAIVINKSHVKLIGQDQHQVVIRLMDQVHSPLLIVGETKLIHSGQGHFITAKRVEDIEVSNLTLDGNLENHDPHKECGEDECGSSPSAIRNNGITIRGASFITIKNVTTQGMVSGGLVTEKYCDHLTIENFESHHNYFDGLAGYQTEDSVFKNLYLHHNRSAGISIDIDFNSNVLENSLIEANSDVGIFARSSRNNLFSNVSIQKSGNHGIFLAWTDHPSTCATDNVFDSIKVNYSKRAGFRLNNNCPGNRITGASNLCSNTDGPISEQTKGHLLVDDSVECRM